MKKDLTPDQAIAGMKNAKDAGMDVLLSFIFGLGGIERSKKHIVETTKLLNLLEPEEMAPMALAVQPGTELAKEIEAGQFIQATPLQILEEEKHLLKNLSNFNTFYWGDHSNNIVSSRGRLPDNRQAFLKKIENAIATHPVTRQKVLTTMANSFEAAALNGQVASTVAMVELDLSLAHFKGLSLHVVFMLIPMIHNYQREAHAEILGRLADIVDAGGLQPVLDEQRFSLEEVGKAHDRFSSGQAMGKIVVEV